MSAASPLATSPSATGAAPPGSLRATLDARRGSGGRHSLADAVALVAPLCRDAATHHATGRTLFVHPSSIVVGRAGATVDLTLATTAPTLPRDRACVAPEQRNGTAGNARATVFSVGAIFYELLTGEVVGPGMKRPSAIVSGLPAGVEIVIGKALVADAAQRPDDLRALAQAIEGLGGDAADGDGLDIDIDISQSMLPPAPTDNFGVTVKPQSGRSTANDPTAQLAELKASLEADPRPRYVVIEQGMDHGPFSAVELLQQLASNKFSEECVLRDDLSKQESPLAQWDSFAPFARQARLHREIKAEKQQIDRVVSAENKATTSKALIGGGAVVVLLLGGVAWFVSVRAGRKDEVRIGQDTAVNVETNGGVHTSSSSATAGVGGRLPTSGAYPMLPGGMSCEGAQAKYVEEMKIGDKTPDLSVGAFGAVLNNGAYLNACGVPSDTHVSVCAAVQNGRAVGVTVTLNPPNGGQASCVAGRIRAMGFPSNPKLDIARTTF